MLDGIYVEIGNICNLDCSFCTKITRKRRFMTAAEFAKVAEKIRSEAKNLYLHVMGEPLLHPEFDAILDLAGATGIPVSITTNGTLLEERSDIILRHAASIKRVSISLHSAEANGLDFERYLSSAIAFARCAAEAGIFAVFRLWNIDSEFSSGKNEKNGEIEARLFGEFGEAKQRRRSGYRLAERIFLEYDGVFVWPRDGEEENGKGRCLALFRQVAILADGSVVPCCLDANGDMTLGNIFDSELRDILSSERAERMRAGFRRGDMVEPLCRTCSFARRFGGG